MYSTAGNRVYGLKYLTVSPSTFFALVNTDEGPYRRQPLIQFSKLSSSQSDKYTASEGFGVALKKRCNLASTGKCTGDFVLGVVAEARIDYCLSEYTTCYFRNIFLQDPRSNQDEATTTYLLRINPFLSLSKYLGCWREYAVPTVTCGPRGTSAAQH